MHYRINRLFLHIKRFHSDC